MKPFVHAPKLLSSLGLVLLTSLAVSSCNETSFKSGGKKEAGDPTPIQKPAQKNIKIPCENGNSKITTTLAGSEKTSVIVDGEFCGVPGNTVQGKLTAFFVLDFSGSMLRNDPIAAGSCGRLKAAQAIVSKLESSIEDGVELSAGLLQFDDKALPPVAPVEFNSFKSHLTEAKFCENTGGATNYEAAFVAAQDILKNVDGKKVIYFISDGLPTKAGANPTSITSILTGAQTSTQIYEAGTKAAQNLRTVVKDLTLNAIYLGNVDPSTTTTATSISPEAYLEQITGDKKNVKLATNADSLATEIVKFDTPDVSELDQSTIKGEISADGFQKKVFEVKTLTKDLSREGVWSFSTDAIDLFARTGSAVANTIKITIQGSDGKPYEATATINLDNQAVAKK